MTTRPTTTPHATSWIQPPPTATHGDHHIARNFALTIGASAVVLAGLAGVQYVRTLPAQTVAAPGTTAVVVPAAALRALAADVGGIPATTTVSVPAAATRALNAELASSANVAVPGVEVPPQAARALQAELQ
jgi:hypothetical protein